MNALLTQAVYHPCVSVLYFALLVGLAALFLELYLCRAEGLSTPRRMVLLVFLAAGLFEEICIEVVFYQVRFGVSFSGMAGTRMQGMPAALWVALALVVCVGSIAGGVMLWKWHNAHLGPSAINEALDRSPQGVCFGDERGVPILLNMAMDDAARTLVGHGVRDVNAFWTDVRSRSAEDMGEDAALVVTETDGALLFRSLWVSAETGRYRQVIADDVTEVYRLTEELRVRNGQLAALQGRLRAYGETVRDVVRSQEVLAAKALVHDELGHALLTTERYCTQEHASELSGEEVVTLWRRTLALLSSASDAQAREGAEALLELTHAAETLGLAVRMDGCPPDDGTALELAIRALRESILNAVKHAGATQLTMTFTPDGFTVCNDGRPPDAPIRETGGLRSLRQAAEAVGAEMHVSAAPAFKLEILLRPRADIALLDLSLI